MPIDEIFEGFKIFVDGAQEWRSIYVKKLFFFVIWIFFLIVFRNLRLKVKIRNLRQKKALPFIGTDGAFNPGIDIDFYESLEGRFF